MADQQNFVDTVHCLSRAHCNTCRDLEVGRPWRKNLMSLFVLPDNQADFECPYGKKWGEKVSPPVKHGTNAAIKSGGQAKPEPSGGTSCTPCSRARAANANKNQK